MLHISVKILTFLVGIFDMSDLGMHGIERQKHYFDCGLKVICLVHL